MKRTEIMDAKLIICLMAVACLVGQTRADDCLKRANEALKDESDVPIPQFVRDIESSLRKKNPQLADLPLNVLIKRPNLDDDVSGFFTADQINQGADDCSEFIQDVMLVLEEAECKYEPNTLDLDQLQEDNKDNLERLNEMIGYMGACLKV